MCVALLSVRVDDKAREGAVFIVVAPMSFAPIQFDEDLITGIQVQDDTVAGIVIVLVSILGNGAGPHLGGRRTQSLLFPKRQQLGPKQLPLTRLPKVV